jgi:hypothetical protein
VRPEPALVAPPTFEDEDERPEEPPPDEPPPPRPPLLLEPPLELPPPPRPPPPLRRSRVWSGETMSDAGTTRRASRDVRALLGSGIEAALIACEATRHVRNCETFMVIKCGGEV